MTPDAGTPQAQIPSSAVVRALLLTDLVGSTKIVEEVGDERAAEIWTRHDRLARDLLAEHGGLEIDKTDGFLLLFERPSEAINYSLAYHRALIQLSKELDCKLRARAGLHLGEVFLRRNSPDDVARGAKPIEVEGLAKPMAARIMSLAGGGQTLLTRAAYDLARRAAVGDDVQARANVVWRSHGPYLFKGVKDAVEVFEVGAKPFAPLSPPPDSEKAVRLREEDIAATAAARRRKRLGFGAALVVALVATLGLLWVTGVLGTRRLVSVEQPRVAILGFHDSAENPGGGLESTACSELLAFALATAGSIELVPPDRLEPVVGELALVTAEGSEVAVNRLEQTVLSALAAETGADVVALGGFKLSAEGEEPTITVGLTLQETTSGRAAELAPVSGALHDLPRLIAGLAGDAAPVLGTEISLAEPENPLPLPNSFEYRSGLEQLRRRSFPTAQDLFSQAVNLEPDNPYLLAALARAQAELGRQDEAQEAMAAAIERSGHLPLHARLELHAQSLVQQRQRRQAAAVYEVLWAGKGEGDRQHRLDLGLDYALALALGGQPNQALTLVEELRALQPPEGDPRLLLAEARAARYLSRFEHELQAAERAAEMAGEQRQQLLAAARLEQGIALRRLGRLEESESILQEARQFFSSAQNSWGEVLVSVELGAAYFKKHDYWNAKTAYDNASRLAASLGNRWMEARTLANKALVLEAQRDYESAVEVLSKALEILAELEDTEAEVTARLNLGGLLTKQLRFAEADETYQAALEITRVGRNRILEAYNLRSLGILHYQLGELDEASHSLEQALDIYELSGNRMGIAESKALLGSVLQTQGDLDRAEAQFREAVAIFEESGNEIPYADALRALGEVELIRGRLDEAGAALHRALEIQERHTSPNASVTRTSLARLKLELGELPEAQRLAEKAVEDQHHLLELFQEVHGRQVLAEILLARGKLDAAQRQLTTGQLLLGETDSPLCRLPRQLTAARIQSARGEHEAALEALRPLLAEATTGGFGLLDMEIRLAVGEIRLAIGDDLGGRSRLKGVATEAELSGYGLLAAKAERLGS